MRILAIDTATLVASVAVWDGDAVAAGEARAQTHSEMLLPLIDQVLARAGLAPADLDAVACGAGPGSFTGLRIGLSTAKGICFAIARPLVLVSSLAALSLEGRGTVMAVLDAKKREVYAGLYQDGVALDAEVVLPPGEVAAWAAGRAQTVVGDGAFAYPEAAASWGPILLEARRTPSAEAVARLAAARLARGESDNLLLAEPTYIRMDVATPPKAR